MLRVTRSHQSRVGVSEKIISVALAIVGLVSYQQLAAPCCAGPPHVCTLPVHSETLAGYPCDGSRLQRTYYVIKQAPFALHDIIRVKLADAWTTAAILTLVTRMVAAFTLPSFLYRQVVAPVTMYVERGIMPLFHLLLGPKHVPSTMALRCMFITYPVFDVTFFSSLLFVWDVNIAVEVAYCVLAAVVHLVVCSWHRDQAPGGRASLAWQLLTRVLVAMTTLYLSMASQANATGRRQQQHHHMAARRIAAVTASAAGTASAAASAAAGGVSVLGRHPGDGVASGKISDGLAKGFEVQQDLAEEEEQQLQGDGSLDSSDGQPPWRCKAETTEVVEAEVAVTKASPIAAVTELEGNVNAKADTDMTATGGLATAAAAAAAGTTERLAATASVNPSPASAPYVSPLCTPPDSFPAFKPSRIQSLRAYKYKSPVQRTALRVKIPWAELDQLAPGFQQRLTDLASQHGLRLAGIYIRSGCIELVLVLEALPPLPPPPPIQSPSLSLLPSPTPRQTPRNTDATAATAGTLGSYPLEVAAVLRALGLDQQQDLQPQLQHQRNVQQPLGQQPRDWMKHCDGVTAAFHRLPLPLPLPAGSGLNELQEEVEEELPSCWGVDDGSDCYEGCGGGSESKIVLGSGRAGYGKGPIVTSILPRAITMTRLRQQQQQQKPEQETGREFQPLMSSASTDGAAAVVKPAAAAAAATTTTAMLHIRASWPSSSPAPEQSQQQQQQQQLQQVRDGAWIRPAVFAAAEPPPIEVLVRSAGTYLPVRVAGSRWRTFEIEETGMPQIPQSRSSLTAIAGDCNCGGGCVGDVSGGGWCVMCSRHGTALRPARHLECEYDVEILAEPPAPGVLLLEIRSLPTVDVAFTTAPTAVTAAQLGVPRGAAAACGDGGADGGGADPPPDEPLLRLHREADEAGISAPAFMDMVPLLATDDTVVAEEINFLAAGMPDGANRDLDELLYDLGTLAVAAVATPAAGVGAAADDARTGTTAAVEAVGADTDAVLLTVLGPHLLSHLEAMGLSATVASIRTGLLAPPPPRQPLLLQPQQKEQQQLGGIRHVAAVALAVNKEGDDSCDASCQGDDWGSKTGSGCNGGSNTGGGGTGGLRSRVVAVAVLQVLGLQAVSPSAAAAYEAFMSAWNVAQGHTIQVVECLCLFSLLVRLIRSGMQPAGPMALVCFVGCSIGTFTTVTWLLLPYRTWVRVANAVKVPRYAGHIAAKALVALGGIPAPPGVSTYIRGPGALFLEGLILPGASLMSLRCAAIISAIKLPLNAAMIFTTGSTRRTWTSVLMATHIEALALATTLACHVYMRLHAYERPAAAAIAAARGRAAVATHGACGAAEGGCAAALLGKCGKAE